LYYAVDDFVEMTPTADHELVAWGDLVYPSPPALADSLPAPLRSLYEEALLVKTRSPTAFVVLARRLLEGICRDRLGDCPNLAAALDALVANGSIPPTLAEASTVVRLAGNLGAHASERLPTLIFASAVDRLLRAIIEYLYVVPVEVVEFRRLLDHFRRESR
jgi:hypothetical protein